ncbi:hypothetical protein [Pseudomonas antarctica]|nr:hypothetical protein [Pseudomonas antarctica]
MARLARDFSTTRQTIMRIRTGAGGSGPQAS